MTSVLCHQCTPKPFYVCRFCHHGVIGTHDVIIGTRKMVLMCTDNTHPFEAEGGLAFDADSSETNPLILRFSVLTNKFVIGAHQNVLMYIDDTKGGVIGANQNIFVNR